MFFRVQGCVLTERGQGTLHVPALGHSLERVALARNAEQADCLLRSAPGAFHVAFSLTLLILFPTSSQSALLSTFLYSKEISCFSQEILYVLKALRAQARMSEFGDYVRSVE